jgi:hypothetical protein
MPLTDSAARNAKPAAKTVRMLDRDGLYLEISPRGGTRTALTSYRFSCLADGVVHRGMRTAAGYPTADQRIELDRRLNAYAVDKNRGRPAADAVRDIRR